MTRTSLYAVIVVLAALVVAFGVYVVWQESQNPKLEIKLYNNGISVNGNG